MTERDPSSQPTWLEDAPRRWAKLGPGDCGRFSWGPIIFPLGAEQRGAATTGGDPWVTESFATRCGLTIKDGVQ